jgi:hypothetical protein
MENVQIKQCVSFPMLGSVSQFFTYASRNASSFPCESTDTASSKQPFKMPPLSLCSSHFIRTDILFAFPIFHMLQSSSPLLSRVSSPAL